MNTIQTLQQMLGLIGFKNVKN